MTMTTALTLLFLAGGLVWLVVLFRRRHSRQSGVPVAGPTGELLVRPGEAWPKPDTVKEQVTSPSHLAEVPLSTRRIRPGRPASRPADSDAGFPYPLWLGADHCSDRRDADSDRDNKPDLGDERGGDTVTDSDGGSDGGGGGSSD